MTSARHQEGQRGGVQLPLRGALFAASAGRILLALIIIAWLAGRILTDRYGWSQWLHWIPTVLVLPVVGMGVLLAWAPARKRFTRAHRLARWSAAAVLIGGYFFFIEHRFLHGDVEDASGVRIVHWTTDYPGRGSLNPFIDVLTGLDADITFMSHAGRLTHNPALAEWVGNDYGGYKIPRAPFAIFTRYPIIADRLLYRHEGIIAAVVVIDTRDLLGRPLVAYLIDLPSNPRQPKHQIASALRAALDELDVPAPDIIMGDFNMARGSASIDRTFPGMRNAFEDAGHGYAATFPRDWPLYHIDHILLNDDLIATDYDIIDPGFGRHRLHAATVQTRRRASDSQ